MAEVSSWDNCSFDTMLINRIKISFLIFFVFPGFSAQQSLKRLLSCIKSIFGTRRANPTKLQAQGIPNQQPQQQLCCQHQHSLKKCHTPGIINLISARAL